jgi:type IV secretory pathway VirB10-like protein
MAPLIYPEPTWSNRFGRFVRTLQLVAVAGAIGAVGGGVAVMTLVGNGNSPHPPTVLKASTTDNGSAQPAAPAAPQPNAAAAGGAAPAAAPPPPPASADPSPQLSPATAEPSSTAAATEQHPIQEAAESAGSSPGTDVYNRVEPEQKAAPAHARVRPKATHRIKNAERRREQSAPSQADRNPSYSGYSAQRSVPYPAERGTRYSNERGGPYYSYSSERYSYRDYDSPPVVRAPPLAGRGFFFGGGGGFYDRGGGWGD